MLCGVRWTSVTACNTSFKTRTPHATSTCMRRILQSVFRFRFVSQRLYPTAPQSTFRLRTLSCTGMPSLYPSSFPGAFTKYSFLFLTTREHLFAHVCQVYRKHTFRHAGPSKDILRMYAVWSCWALYSSGTYRHIFLQYVLAVLVSIQLSVFVLVNAMALWVDQLLHSVIKELSLHTTVYDGTFLTTTLVGHDQILLLGCH